MNDLVKRTIFGVLFLVVMLAGMLLHPVAFGVLFLFVLYLSIREFLHITMGERWILQQKLALLTASTVYLLVLAHCFYDMDARWLVLALVPFFAIPVSVIMSRSHEGVEDVAFAYMALLYIGIPICLTPFIVSSGGEFKGYILLNIFLLIWSADVGSYSLGTLLGQKPDSRKLAPLISPKKSWWGFWGGIILSVVAAVALHFIGIMPYALPHCIALGLIVPVLGVCGDLFESVWKRRYGFKDSGKCIPGHGGMLDRFDSSLFAIPAAFVYLTLFGLL